MKRTKKQAPRASDEELQPCEAAARLLEDLAEHVDDEEEKQRYLAEASNLRSCAGAPKVGAD